MNFIARKAAWGWALAFAFTLWVYAGAYSFTIEKPYRLGDFFQEWASAKNYFEGLPIYTPQEITAWRYLGVRPDYTQQIFVQMNGHPPPCALIALPLAKLDYAAALFIWNGLSLACFLAATAIALRMQAGTACTWLWLPILTVALANPFAQHVILGQFGALLLLLIVGGIWADGRDRGALAGLLIGTAAAIKLFPALLFLYFVIHRKWRTVAAGAAAFLGWHAACAAVMGLQTYDHFVRYSMPEVLRYRDWWPNYSITGMWFKLFDCSSGQSLPLWFNPVLAKYGALASNGLIVALTAFAIHRARARAGSDRSAWAVVITAMILTTPVAWDHYFLLLLWPLLWLGLRTPAKTFAGAAYFACLIVFWINPIVLYSFPASATRIMLLTSWPFYAVLATFALSYRAVIVSVAASETTTNDVRSLTAAHFNAAAGA